MSKYYILFIKYKKYVLYIIYYGLYRLDIIYQKICLYIICLLNMLNYKKKKNSIYIVATDRIMGKKKRST